MRHFKIIFISFFILFYTNLAVHAQPIPVELMFGNNYGVVNLAFSKNFSENSKFGFFHVNSVQFDYNDESKNSLILQDLIYVEAVKNFRFTSGVAYSKSGFNPTVGVQYVNVGKTMLFLCSPRINIETEPSYDIMTMIQFRPEINEHLKLFTKAQFLNVFNADGNIKSYQWIRIGLDTKGFQFGIGINFDEYGPDPSVDNNIGLFIRREIF